MTPEGEGGGRSVTITILAFINADFEGRVLFVRNKIIFFLFHFLVYSLEIIIVEKKCPMAMVQKVPPKY
jgi:hypothetical protein